MIKCLGFSHIISDLAARIHDYNKYMQICIKDHVRQEQDSFIVQSTNLSVYKSFCVIQALALAHF